MNGEFVNINIDKLLQPLQPVLHHPSWMWQHFQFFKEALFIIQPREKLKVLSLTQHVGHLTVDAHLELAFETVGHKAHPLLGLQLLVVVVVEVFAMHGQAHWRHSRKQKYL